MKKILLTITALLILILTAALLYTYYKVFHTKPLTQQELTLLTPDWSKITHNNWSPWHTLPDGTKEWNPAASYNTWIDSIPNENKAWPELIDLRYEHWDYLLNEFIGFTPNDTEYWNQTVSHLNNPISEIITDRYLAILKKPHLGCGLYMNRWTRFAGDPLPTTRKTRDPDEFAAMKKHGIENAEQVGNGVDNLDLFSANQGSTGTLNGATNFLVTQAYYNFQQGKADRFIEIIETTSLSTRFYIEYQNHIHQLAAISRERKINEAIEWSLIQQTQLTDAHLKRLDQLVARHQARTLNSSIESLIFHDSVRRLVNSRGSIIRHNYKNTVYDLVGTPFNGHVSNLKPDAQRLLLVFDSHTALLSTLSVTTDETTTRELEALINANIKLLSTRAALLFNHAIQSDGLVLNDVKTHQTQSAELRMVIASKRHEIRHGNPPAEHKEIDQDLLPKELPMITP